jgi:hypothetical protein
LEEKLSSFEMDHPYAAENRVRREIARVEKMTPEAEKFLGPKGPKLEELNRKLKAIKEYKRNGYAKHQKSKTAELSAEQKAEARKSFESYFK